MALLGLVVSCLQLQAQANLKGKVYDEKKAPLFAANVYFKQFPEGGTTTDFEGAFELSLAQVKLPDSLIVSFLGFEEQKLWLEKAEALPSVIYLRESSKLLSVVQIEAKRPISSEFSIRELDKFDIYAVPFSFADPLKAITILPSSTNTDETADVALRGSSGSQSLVTLNGVPIANPVRSTNLVGNGFFSIFNPELVKSQIVYAGNPPLSYGNTTAGLVEIETVDRVDNNFTQFSVGLANAGFMHGRQFSKKVSMHLYSNFQTSQVFKALNSNSFKFLNHFRVNDLGLQLHAQLKQNLWLDWFSYGLDENSSVNSELFTYRGPADARSRRTFHLARLMWVKGQWVFSSNLGGDFNHGQFNFGAIDNNNRTRRYYAAWNAKWNLFEAWTLQGGMTTDYSETRYQNQNAEFYYALAPTAPKETLDGLNYNNNQELYLLSKSKFFAKKLSLISAWRKNIPTQERQISYWSQQVIVKYGFDKKSFLSANTGLYHGYTLPTAFNTNYRFTRTLQHALEYEYRSKKLELDAAIFSKSEGGDVFLSLAEIYQSREIKGIETRVQWNLHRYFQITGSYSLLDVQNRTPDGTTYAGRNDMAYFSRLFLTYNKPRLANLSLAYIFRQGLLYSPAIGGQLDADLGVYEPFFEDQFNTHRFKNYHNLSFSMSKEIPQKDNFLLFFATINNLLNLKNQQTPLYFANYSGYNFDYNQLRSFYFGLVWKI